MSDRRKLGMVIRNLRKSRGFTQAELAESAGVAANTLAMLERGERSVSPRMLNAIGRRLNVPGSCLMILGASVDKQPDESSRKLLSAAQSLIQTLIRAQRATNAGVRQHARRKQRASA